MVSRARKRVSVAMKGAKNRMLCRLHECAADHCDIRATPLRLPRRARGDDGLSGYTAGPGHHDQLLGRPRSPVELARARATSERDVCRWLLAAERIGAHARAGFAS